MQSPKVNQNMGRDGVREIFPSKVGFSSCPHIPGVPGTDGNSGKELVEVDSGMGRQLPD